MKYVKHPDIYNIIQVSDLKNQITNTHNLLASLHSVNYVATNRQVLLYSHILQVPM